MPGIVGFGGRTTKEHPILKAYSIRPWDVPIRVEPALSAGRGTYAFAGFDIHPSTYAYHGNGRCSFLTHSDPVDRYDGL